MIGKSLGPYKILEQLGVGGMGEVYLGEDVRLGRKVAIKVLPAEFASDAERLARFEQEARAAAALNHPHIAVIHDIGTEPNEEGVDTHFMVQEYLEGQSLRERLDKGALPMGAALNLAIEVSEALIAAHEAGIVHRDLKPDNIFVTRQGHAKVLDFGLAKLTEVSAPSGGQPSMSPTLLGTVAGQIMGTAGYMAPEQVNGEDVDHRADLFAFGALLHEMVAGSKAFPGQSIPDVLSKILHAEPVSFTDAGVAAPRELSRIVRKCLAKDRERRYQSTADLRVDLRNVAGELESGAALDASGAASSPAPADDRPATPVLSVTTAIIVGVAAIGLAALGFILGRQTASIPETDPGRAALQAELLVTPAATMERSVLRVLTFAPEGEEIIFAATDEAGERRLYRRRLDAPLATPIAGTEGGAGPMVSPDGEWILFWADGALAKVPRGGGAAEILHRLTDDTPDRNAVGWSSDLGSSSDVPYGMTWDGNDAVIYARFQGGLWRVPAAGGAPEPVTSLEGSELSHRTPFALLGGGVLFTAHSRLLGLGGHIEVLTPDGEKRRLIDDGSDPRYVDPGVLLFAREGALMAVQFDPATFAVSGEPTRVLADVSHMVGGMSPGAASGVAHFDVSRDGALAFLPGGANPSWESTLAWLMPDGDVEVLTDTRRSYLSPKLSPDGAQVLVAAKQSGDFNSLLLIDAQRGAATTLVPGIFGVWTPDGASVIYALRTVDGSQDIHRTPAAADSRPVELVSSEYSLWPSSVSSDGRYLLYVETHPQTGNDIWYLDMEGNDDPQPLLNTTLAEVHPVFSPDDRWLVFASNEQGEYRVFVQPFPGPGRKTEVSGGEGSNPVWSRTGDAIFFARDDANGEPVVWRTPLTLDEGVHPGLPELFSPLPVGTTTPVGGFDINLEANRVLTPYYGSEGDSGTRSGGRNPGLLTDHFRIWLGWGETLRQALSR